MKTLTQLFDELQAVVDNPVAQLDGFIRSGKRLLAVSLNIRQMKSSMLRVWCLLVFGAQKDVRSQKQRNIFLLSIVR